MMMMKLMMWSSLDGPKNSVFYFVNKQKQALPVVRFLIVNDILQEHWSCKHELPLRIKSISALPGDGVFIFVLFARSTKEVPRDSEANTHPQKIFTREMRVILINIPSKLQ
jgi:hypothetical protein